MPLFISPLPNRFIGAGNNLKLFGSSSVSLGPISVAAGADDAEIWGTNFYDNGESADFEGWIGTSSTPQWVFLRFILPSAIPAGSTITAASVDVFSSAVSFWNNSTSDINLRATDVANASAPTTAAQRPVSDGGSTATTAAIVTWSNVTMGDSAYHTSADISSIIQELVNDNSGLANGAGIVIWLREANGLGEYANIRLVGHATPKPAKLNITYI